MEIAEQITLAAYIVVVAAMAAIVINVVVETAINEFRDRRKERKP